MNAPTHFPAIARREARERARIADERFAWATMAKVAAELAKRPNDPQDRLLACEIAELALNADLIEEKHECRKEIGAYGISDEGYPLTYQGDLSLSGERIHVPFSVRLKRFRFEPLAGEG